MHQHFIKGKKLLLIYKDGTQEVAKYRVSDKGTLYFSDHKPRFSQQVEMRWVL